MQLTREWSPLRMGVRCWLLATVILLHFTTSAGYINCRNYPFAPPCRGIVLKRTPTYEPPPKSEMTHIAAFNERIKLLAAINHVQEVLKEVQYVLQTNSHELLPEEKVHR